MTAPPPYNSNIPPGAPYGPPGAPYGGGPGVPPPGAMVTKVELTIACEGLRDLDITSKSDPMCVLFMNNNGRLTEVGRTERIDDNLNPKFEKQIIIDYHFEEVQKVVFRVYDIDSSSNSLHNADFLGQCECTLGQIVSASNYKKPLEINGQRAGTIIVQSQEQGGEQRTILMTMKGVKLDKKDFFGKSDPFLEFHRELLDGSYALAHRTEVIKNTLNPSWKPFRINARRLANNNPDTSIKIECYDWNSSGTHDMIGICYTSLAELEQTRSGKTWALVHPKKKEKRGYKHSGEIVLDHIEIKREYTFVEYIQVYLLFRDDNVLRNRKRFDVKFIVQQQDTKGGCELNFVVGIDFTGSNGDPRDPSSLHYIGNNRPNQYMEALSAVGNVIQDYDADQLYPAFGFGASLPPTWQVSHQFSLNGNPNYPDCQGVQGILAAYQQCIHSVRLYGPTNASPIISSVARMARESLQTSGAGKYFILLMLTDGILTDMSETINTIIEASSLPMSVIIVGVGDADFSDMECLDADGQLLRLGRKVAKRDIVQFVPFRDFKTVSPARLASSVLEEVPGQTSPAHLAATVLKEVPDQVVEFFNRTHIIPPPRLSGTQQHVECPY